MIDIVDKTDFISTSKKAKIKLTIRGFGVLGFWGFGVLIVLIAIELA